MKKPILYVVKSVVSPEYEDEFNEWYHKKHLPKLIGVSGCKSVRRFKAIEAEDKFNYMGVYEFGDLESYRKYDTSAFKQEMLQDFGKTFGDRAPKFKRELRRSLWELVHPLD